MAHWKRVLVTGFMALAGIFLGQGAGWADENLHQTGEIASIESAPKVIEHAFAVGGFGNVAIATNDQLESIGGGGVKARYTWREFLSFESSIDFNRFISKGPENQIIGGTLVEGEDTGKLFALPFLQSILIHTPSWNNLSLFALGGVGYQFNDTDHYKVNFKINGVPVGSTKADVDGGVIAAVGGGFDWRITRHLLFNFDVRVQFAQFDITSKGVIPGVGPVKIKDEQNFDTVVVRTGLLYRF